MNRSVYAVLLSVFSAVLLFSSIVHAALLGKYTFTGLSGAVTSAPPDAPQPANGSLSDMTEGDGLADQCSCGENVFWANNAWMESSINDAVDQDDFFEFTLSPDAGYQVTLEKIEFEEKRSPSGPTTYAIRSSLDGYSSDLFTSVTHTSMTSATLTLGGTDFTNRTASITFRFYAFGASNHLGAWRIDNVYIHGSITQANRSCTDIALSSITIPENEPSGSLVGTFSAADPDAGNTHTYHLVVSPRGLLDAYSFYIDGNTLKTRKSFNYEGKNSYSVYVRCNDNCGGSCFKTFTISVADVNEPPTRIRLTMDRADEGTPIGTTLGTFLISDPDTEDTHSYSLVSGEGDTDNQAFTIEGDTLIIGTPFDYETKSRYSIRVRATDSGANTYERQISIWVRDLNEPPSDIILSSSVVDESPSSVKVGLLSATDENSKDAHTFALVSGEGDADNRAFWICSQNYLRTRRPVDYETRNSYSVRIRAEDGKGGAVEKAFTVAVADVNEPPSEIHLTSTILDENCPADMEIGTFSASDPDIGDIHTYALVSGEGDADNGLFRIRDGNRLSAAASFDYENCSAHTIRVRVTDTQGESCEQSFELAVRDADEAPFVANPIGSIETENTGEIITADLSEVFTDPEGDAIEMRAEVSAASDIANAAIIGNTLRLQPHGCGTSTITIIATSGEKSATDTLTLMIRPLPGDTDCNGTIELRDALRLLKLLTGQDVPNLRTSDMNEDEKMGMEELISVLSQLVEK